MAERRRSNRWLYRLPRLVYWAAGAAVAFGGALGARLLAQGAPSSHQVVIWLTGAVLIFIGLAILSMGTRARLEVELLFANDKDQPNNTNNENDSRPNEGP